MRIPPQNLDAEKAVLASILIENTTVSKVVDILTPTDFYDPRHVVLFEAIVRLFNQNKPVDALTLTNELKKSKKLKLSGGASYLSDVISSTSTSGNIVEYAKLVKETSVRRSMISFSSRLEELARNESLELGEILNETEKNLLGLNQDTATQDLYDASTLLEMQMERADEFAKNPDELRGLSTGLANVDKLLGGLHKSDLVILAARPSVGKSSFAFHMARIAAVELKKTVMIFSLEMPAVQVIERMLAQQIKVNLWNLRMGKMSDDDYKKYSSGAGKIAESRILVSDIPGINIAQLRSRARKVKVEQGLDLIIVDYLQLMQGMRGTQSENRALEIGEISRSLKILARELNIPVVALSQLNRAVENRSDRIPQLSDLRESGSIEQDADVVLFLSREMNVENMESEKINIDLHVAKHRNGPVGKVSIEFFAPQQLYTDK